MGLIRNGNGHWKGDLVIWSYGDAYDKDFKKIDGMTLVRGEEKSIPKGVFHLICGVLVKHIDETLLITKRDKDKVHDGMWEATCGGSAF